jgi:hypothetical protein
MFVVVASTLMGRIFKKKKPKKRISKQWKEKKIRLLKVVRKLQKSKYYHH